VKNEADRRYGIERYWKETRRLYNVLDKRLGQSIPDLNHCALG